MDIAILIQARLSSSRLPGKILYQLGNKNINCISLMSKRLLKFRNLTDIALITTDQKCDDCIEYISKINNLHCLRGNNEDVLERYYFSANSLNAKTIVRLTSDCPLIDAAEVQRVIDIHLQNKNDYTSNTFEGSSIIDGFDVEVFEFEALKKAYEESVLPSEREHVTFYFKNNNKFKVEFTDPKLNFPYTRLTLDTPEDFKVISLLIDNCKNIETISMLEIGNLYYELKLDKLNGFINKNHGWNSSFVLDNLYKENN